MPTPPPWATSRTTGPMCWKIAGSATRRWAEMLQRFAQINQQIRQTADAFLLSPTLRNKARFMNVGPLLRFARRVLMLLKTGDPHEKAKQTVWVAAGIRRGPGGMAGTVRPGREDDQTGASARVECGDADGTGERVGGTRASDRER